MEEGSSASDNPGKSTPWRRDAVGWEVDINIAQAKKHQGLKRTVAGFYGIENVESMDFRQLCEAVEEIEAAIAEALPVGTIVIHSKDSNQQFVVSSDDFTKDHKRGWRTVELCSKTNDTHERVPLYNFKTGLLKVALGPVEPLPPPENPITGVRHMVLEGLRQLLKDTVVDDVLIIVAAIPLARKIYNWKNRTEQRVQEELEKTAEKLRRG